MCGMRVDEIYCPSNRKFIHHFLILLEFTSLFLLSLSFSLSLSFLYKNPVRKGAKEGERVEEFPFSDPIFSFSDGRKREHSILV